MHWTITDISTLRDEKNISKLTIELSRLIGLLNSAYYFTKVLHPIVPTTHQRIKLTIYYRHEMSAVSYPSGDVSLINISTALESGEAVNAPFCVVAKAPHALA